MAKPEFARTSIARHHNEWLSLLDVSGPFLSIPVLLRALPQGLEAHESDVARDLRSAFDEWEEAVPRARAPDPAIHTAWLDHVFREVLGYPATHWLTGTALPPGLEATLTDHGETLRASHALKAPGDTLPRLLVQIWPAPQALDKPVAGARWQVASPHTRMMTLLHATGVPLGLATNGAQWTLVAARPGQVTTFVTWHAHLWAEEPLTLRAIRTLLSARRFFGSEPGDDLASLIEASLSDQQEVTDQLGLQVRSAVEVLVRSLDRINAGMGGRLLREVTPGQLYQAAPAVMMRLVFLLCAEERRLLPADDALYARHYAIGTLRDQLREAADRGSEQVLESRHDAWARLLATFRLVHGGCEHSSLRLPAYGGSLFDPDRHPFLEGRPSGTGWHQVVAQPLPVSNRTVLHLLEALQFLQMRVPGGSTEARRLSFRALDIEQIGHVYEGLLDHTARRADEPVLGLGGAKGKDCELTLSVLEAKIAEGVPSLLDFLKDRTGRGAAALQRAVESPPTLSADQLRTLQRACGADAVLLARVQPWTALLRDDSEGLPVVVHPGSVYVTRGSDRRSTGTHYTPRALTERVVATTLAPLVYVGVDQGQEPARRPFHWLAEFPEVFMRRDGSRGGGFDAIVGNPPFVGGQKVTGPLGTDYRDYLVNHVAGGRRGSTNLCVFFTLRASTLVRPAGVFGMLSDKTVAEGDSRLVGLEALLANRFSIFAAWHKFEWPGSASVAASEVHLHRASREHMTWGGRFVLEGHSVPTISAFLTAEEEWSPKPLVANAGNSFVGSYVLGLGFAISEAAAEALIAIDPRNAEVLFPYINGDDLNSHPEHKPSRWVINFWDWPLDRTAHGSWLALLSAGRGEQID